MNITEIIFDEVFNIRMAYIDDDSKEQKISLHKNADGVGLELHNFNNPLGTATKNPLLVAEADGRKVFISISVEAIGEIKLVSFTLYIEDRGKENAEPKKQQSKNTSTYRK